MNIFEDGHKKYKHMKIIRKWTWAAFNWNSIFLVVKSLTYSFIFSFLIGFGVGRWKKKNCWETQSKHYSDIYKNISHFSRLCFFLEKDFIWETDVGKTKCAVVLHFCLILSFLLTLQFQKQLRSKRCNVQCDIFFMKMIVTKISIVLTYTITDV